MGALVGLLVLPSASALPLRERGRLKGELFESPLDSPLRSLGRLRLFDAPYTKPVLSLIVRERWRLWLWW